MKILITGGRSPYTLELIRLFGKQGYEVYLLEYIKLNLSQYSNYLSKSFIITAPNSDFDKFKTEFIEIIESQSFDLVIPTCEDIFQYAQFKDEIAQYSTPFFEDISILNTFHNKFDFNQKVKAKGLKVPKTWKLRQYQNQLANKKLVLKREFSRFGTDIRIIDNEQGQWPDPSEDWIVQEFIEGQEASIFALLKDGKITAFSCYQKQYAVEGATILFKSYCEPLFKKWLEALFKNETLSGQFSFDIIVKDKQIFPLECNPRLTSGIHLFSDQPGMVEAFFNPAHYCEPTGKQQYMIGLAMLVYKFNLKNFKSWWKDFRKSKDIFYDRNDIKPFFTQFVSFGYFVIQAILKRKSPVEVTTLDFEYNGPSQQDIK